MEEIHFEDTVCHFLFVATIRKDNLLYLFFVVDTSSPGCLEACTASHVTVRPLNLRSCGSQRANRTTLGHSRVNSGMPPASQETASLPLINFCGGWLCRKPHWCNVKVAKPSFSHATRLSALYLCAWKWHRQSWTPESRWHTLTSYKFV